MEKLGSPIQLIRNPIEGKNQNLGGNWLNLQSNDQNEMVVEVQEVLINSTKGSIEEKKLNLGVNLTKNKRIKGPIIQLKRFQNQKGIFSFNQGLS